MAEKQQDADIDLRYRRVWGMTQDEFNRLTIHEIIDIATARGYTSDGKDKRH